MTLQVTQRADGLTIASDHMATAETVSLGVWVSAGTRYEAQAVNGIAHLLEHMAFKGTARRSAFAIAQEIEAVGGYLNAYTSREATAYYAKILAKDAPLAVDIIADILQHPAFEEAELQRERGVVLQEIGQAMDTPDDMIFDHFQEVAFPDQPLGRPVLGRVDIVNGLGRDHLKAFLDNHYGPRRMVVAAAGQIEHDRLMELSEAAFDALTADGGSSLETARYQGGEYRETRDLEQVHLLFGFPSCNLLDEDYYAVNLLSTLFGGGMSSRLFQEVREKRGLAYSIYSFNASYLDGGLFGVYAGTGPGEVEELIPVLCDAFNQLGGSLDQEELDRASAQMKASLLMSRESTSSRCEQLAQQILTYGAPLDPDDVLKRIDQVTLADLKRLAGKFLTSQPTMASIGPLDRLEAMERTVERLG